MKSLKNKIVQFAIKWAKIILLLQFSWSQSVWWPYVQSVCWCYCRTGRHVLSLRMFRAVWRVYFILFYFILFYWLHFFLFHSLYSLLCCSFLPLDVHPYKTNLIRPTVHRLVLFPFFLVSVQFCLHESL